MIKHVANLGLYSRQAQSVEQQRRILSGDFRMICQDGSTIGGSKKEGVPMSTSIHYNAQRKTTAERIKRQARRRMNVQMRAALNAEFAGESGSKSAGEYHTRLKALSRGAA